MSNVAISWWEVSRGSFYPAFVRSGTAVYVRAPSRLGAEHGVQPTSQSTSVMELSDGPALIVPTQPAEARDETPMAPEPFIVTTNGDHVSVKQPVPEAVYLSDLGIWAFASGGTTRFLADHETLRYVAPGSDKYLFVDPGGTAWLCGPDRVAITLDGRTEGWVWTPDGTGVYLTTRTPEGSRLWFYQSSSDIEDLGLLPPSFLWLVGATSEGPISRDVTGDALLHPRRGGVSRFTPATDEEVVAFSPDGRSLVLGPHSVSVMKASQGGPACRVRNNYFLVDPECWSGAGNCLALYALERTTRSARLLLFSLDGSALELLADLVPPTKEMIFDWTIPPAFLSEDCLSVVLRAGEGQGEAATWLVFVKPKGGQ